MHILPSLSSQEHHKVLQQPSVFPYALFIKLPPQFVLGLYDIIISIGLIG